MPPRVSEREKLAVRTAFARMDAARAVWKPLAEERRLFQEALANRFPAVMPGAGGTGTTATGFDGIAREQVNVNLTSRVVAYLKSKFDRSPEIRIAGMRDGDIKTAAMNEHLLSRVMERGGAWTAARKAIDDMMTLGPWIVWLGVDTYAVDHARLAGLATDPGELVAAAAQGGDVHPLPGMDLMQVAETARNVYVESTWTRTEAQKQNLLRLAAEAEAMFEEERSKPQTFTPYRVWYRATPYGHSCLVDSTVWDLQDAKWMTRDIVMSPDQFRAWEPFKAAARRQAKPSTMGPESGHKTIEIYSFDYDPIPQPVTDLNKCFRVHEVWDRVEEKVHYCTEGWPGWLEEDDSYPYMGSDGRPVWDDFFPCEWVVPYRHNFPDPTQPIGVPAIAYGYPQQIETIKMRSYGLAAAKRTARIYTVNGKLEEDQRAALVTAVDGTMIEEDQQRPDPARPMLELLPTGEPPTAYFMAARQAEADFYAMMSVAPSQITGEPVAETLGQEELVTRGAGAIQGDLLTEVGDGGCGGLVRKTADIVRLFFTAQHVARYVGLKYVTPTVDQTGKVVEPAPFEQWKADSLDGVDITVSLATKGHGDDPIAIKQLMDAIGICLNFKDATGLFIKDPKPLFDLLFKRMNLGWIPQYEPTKAEALYAALQKVMEGSQGGQPGEKGGAPIQSGGKPAGNRDGSDGRRKGGERGKPTSPGAQQRGRKPMGAGDLSNRATRTGAGVGG